MKNIYNIEFAGEKAKVAFEFDEYLEILRENDNKLEELTKKSRKTNI